MHNDFVIVDLAGVKDCATAAEVLQAIAENGCVFISRGGEVGGTHKANLKI